MEKEEMKETKSINEEQLEENNIKDETIQEEQRQPKEKKVKKNKQLEELLNKMKNLEEETLRAKADLINYRRRKDEEVSNLLKYANVDLITSILPVLDNFERVIDKSDITEDVKNYLEGFKLIYSQLKEILTANDVKEIEALGKEFDPNYHQSITTRKDETKESGIVLEVYQKGYTYKDKILRPAMVIINE